MSESMVIEPRIRCLSLSDTHGKFVVEPLERGYGMTLGTALRRTLLSSIPGPAVTAVRVEGVPHEFSTMPGIHEDLLEVLLNLKDLALRVQEGPGEELVGRQWTGRLQVEGSGEVTGGDIDVPPELEVVNPELHIATLVSDDARLSMELTIEEGVGYRGVEDQQRGRRDPIDLILTDAIFSPVKRVNPVVEPTRVGRRTDLDRLVLEVWTNGGVKPDEAVAQAARILDRYVRLFFMVEEMPTEPPDEIWGSVEEDYFLRKPIEELDLSSRTYNALKREAIHTLRDLVGKTEDELIEIKNFGKKALTEVEDKLGTLGLSLRQPVAEEPLPAVAEEDEDEAEPEE